DARYEIFVHPGMDVMSKSFADSIAKPPYPTYVFICLGSDDANIRAAVRLRTLFKREGADPVIQAVVGDAETGGLLKDAKTFDDKEYDIEVVGDLKCSYSEETLTPEDLNDKALDIHWGYNAGKTKEQCKQSFYGYEYNYYSSLAAAIHKELREKGGVTVSNLSDEILQAMEHRRWCAFMLTEGYAPPEPGEQARLKNHLAKTHPDLVVYRRLDEKERQKNAFAGGGRGNPAGQANEPNEPNGEEPDGE
ncbi:MAG: hypothetical protein ILO68_02450, partial [Clostridia bacterium]|nr:hypothetical protein [Clostridia bacterium]